MFSRSDFPLNPVTRLAPSPTGYIHAGHVLNGIYVQGIADALGGRVICRFEDHDGLRCKDEYITGLGEDFRLLGFISEDTEIQLQSRQEERYNTYLERLQGQGLIYACDCSRKKLLERIQTNTGQTARMGQETAYDGFCRERGLAHEPGRNIRLRFSEQLQEFNDLLLGPLSQTPALQCGDLLLRDNRGQWTYQFAVTVDDIEGGVNLVIRGEDLLPSTGRQLQLMKLLGESSPPVYLHHPLILEPDGEKLSKQKHSVTVREQLAGGLSVPELLAQTARAGGLPVESERLEIEELGPLFAGLIY